MRSSQNKCIRSIFFARKKENVTPYYNLLGILKLDNVFQLKIAIFVYKILAETNDVPTVFAGSIEVVSPLHFHNTRFASRQNLSRPRARTNYGIQKFKFISSQIWESINPEIKRSNSMSIFKIYSIPNYFTNTPLIIPWGNANDIVFNLSYFIYLVKLSLKSFHEAVINSKAYCYFDHCVQYVLYLFSFFFSIILCIYLI